MFSPVNGTGTPSLSSLTTDGGGATGGLLDRATAMYQKNHQEARDDAKAAEAKADEARKKNAEANAKRREAAEAERTARDQHDQADAQKQRAADIQKQIDAIDARLNTLRPQADAADAKAKQLVASAGSDAAKKQAATDAKNEADTLRARIKLGEGQIAVLKTSQQEAQAAATQGAQAAAAADQAASKARASAPPESEDVPAKSDSKGGSGGIAVVATYEMKKIHQSGHYTIDLNKYTTDSLTLRFDENIGDLRSLMTDTGHFRQVNLDDPLYRQREIAVFVDGLNAQDFGQYINFVTVQMRKKHATGDLTEGDVRIDRTNFNKEGNRFTFLYGWKNDTDRRRWLEYEYRP